jgi:general secretion pathway protein A
MYEKHFQLKTTPFSVSPDPKFLYPTSAIKEALATLAYGVNNRKGFILLTGDVGTGKTTILNIFMQWLRSQNAATAFIYNPRLRPEELLDFMLADFHVRCPSTVKSRRLLRLTDWLLERHREGQPVVLVVDEAQQLSADVLEELRLLTNLETPTEKLLQIVLSGQPELDTLLAHPSLRQLRQRITLRCRTGPFSAEQTKEYIEQRLSIAGAERIDIFSPEAVASIHELSGGIARIINVLCEQALIHGFCENKTTIGMEAINAIAREYNLTGTEQLSHV